MISQKQKKILAFPYSIYDALICDGAEYVDDEYLTRKLLTIWGDADMVDEILKRKSAEDLGKFTPLDGDTDDADDTPTADEAIDAAERLPDLQPD